MGIHKPLNKVKEMMSLQLAVEYKGKTHRISYRTASSLAGFIAFGLIVNGTLDIQSHPIFGVLRIAYAFGVMLPISYYQMRKSEEINESSNNPIGNK